jgi:exopolysaccharide production protein ExoQ
MRQTVKPFATLYLLMLTGAPYVFFSSVQEGSISAKAGESIGYQVIWLLLYIALLSKLTATRRLAFKTLVEHPLPIALLICGIMSYALFPPDDFAPVLKYAMYFMTVMFGLWLSVSTSVDETFARFTSLGPLVFMFHWVAFPFVSQSLVYDVNSRPTIFGTAAYGGVFGHKNLAGAYFGLLTVLVANNLLAREATNRLTSAFKGGAYLVTLLLTGAAGPILSAGATIALLCGVHLESMSMKVAYLYRIALVLVLPLILMFGLSGLLGSVGRDTSFSGRNFLLNMWPQFFMERPLFGYGYAGFFSLSPNSPSAALIDLAEWHTRFVTFESSYLELGIQFGLVGGGLIICILIGALSSAWRFHLQFERCVYKDAPVAVLCFIVISSISDTYLLLHNYMFTALVYWAYFGLSHAPLTEPSHKESDIKEGSQC